MILNRTSFQAYEHITNDVSHSVGCQWLYITAFKEENGLHWTVLTLLP